SVPEVRWLKAMREPPSVTASPLLRAAVILRNTVGCEKAKPFPLADNELFSANGTNSPHIAFTIHAKGLGCTANPSGPQMDTAGQQRKRRHIPVQGASMRTGG